MKLLRSLLLLLLICSSAVFGMQPEKQLFHTHLASRLRTTGHAVVGLSLCAAASKIMPYYFCNFPKNDSCAPYATTQFVREELKKSGIQNPEKVEVKIGNEWSTYRNNTSQYLLIEPQASKFIELKNLVEKEFKNIIPDDFDVVIKEFSGHPLYLRLQDAYYDSLNKYKGIIDHEAQHLIHNDSRSCAHAKAASYLVTGLVPAALLYHNARRITQQKVPRMLHTELLAAAATATLANTLYYALRRRQEQRADDGIRNEVNVLKAMRVAHKKRDNEITKTHLQQYDELHKEALESWGKGRYVQYLFNEYYRLKYLYVDPWFDTHPSDEHRAQRFQERLNALEKAEQEKSQQPK